MKEEKVTIQEAINHGIYSMATETARKRKQVIGEKNDLYITLQQLEIILGSFYE